MKGEEYEKFPYTCKIYRTVGLYDGKLQSNFK